MPDTRTRAQRNRAVRQEELREQLRQQKHLEKAVDLIEKISDVVEEMDSMTLQRLSKGVEYRMRVVNKYLPDLKAQEITGPDGEPLERAQYNFVITDPKRDTDG